MKKIIVIFSLLILTLVSLFILINALDPGNEAFSGEYSYTHSHTKAICDKGNYCKDYEIFCNNKDVLSMRFTGAAIQFSHEWEDPRSQSQIGVLC